MTFRLGTGKTVDLFYSVESPTTEENMLFARPGRLVNDILAGDRKTANLFYSVESPTTEESTYAFFPSREILVSQNYFKPKRRYLRLPKSDMVADSVIGPP
jgi:hypothetical protein